MRHVNAFISLSVFTLLTAAVPVLAAVGGAGPGGGDRCEERFKEVTADLQKWIQDGGARHLQLPTGITPDIYAQSMLERVAKARITCLSAGDPGYPVLVNGKPKECRNFTDDLGQLRIECDREKFYSSLKEPNNDAVQYRIAHHEYASLSGFEPHEEDNSSYQISNQIIGFLEDQTVKKLVVKTNLPSPIRWVRVSPDELQCIKWTQSFSVEVKTENLVEIYSETASAKGLCETSKLAAKQTGKALFVNLTTAAVVPDDGSFLRESISFAEKKWAEVKRVDSITCQVWWKSSYDLRVDGFIVVEVKNGKFKELHKLCLSAIYQARADRTGLFVNRETGEALPATGFYRSR